MEQTTAVATTNGQEVLTVKNLFARDEVRKKFEELLGKRAPGFITSVLQCVASNDMLKNAEPATIYHAAAVAATLDLPLNNSLGMAYIVPYNAKQKDGSYKVMAQFQMGYKSFVQLAQRSGQFKTISTCAVYEGDTDEDVMNRLTAIIPKAAKTDKVIGYASYFKLINGFEKSLYMTVEDLKAHGTKYSQTFKKGFGLWKDAFEAMASKTVMKLLLSKFAPLSIEMQKAVITDQAIIKDTEATDVEYVDNQEVNVNPHLLAESKERDRIKEHIEKSKNMKQLNEVAASLGDDQELIDLFNNKSIELSK